MVIKSLVFALSTLAVSTFLFSASLDALMAAITFGLHASGMVDVEEVCADADVDSTETEEEACANDGVEKTDSVSSSTFRLDMRLMQEESLVQGAWLVHQPYLLPTPVLLYEKISGSNVWILFPYLD